MGGAQGGWALGAHLTLTVLKEPVAIGPTASARPPTPLPPENGGPSSAPPPLSS